MTYDFNPKIVNNNKVEDFFNEKSFVGYILPDGTIFQCINHNVSDANTVLRMYLDILTMDYKSKDELFNTPTNSKLVALVANRLKNMSYEQICAFNRFVHNNSLVLSDLLVSFFGCHLVTRLKKEILTSESDHSCFYNYLLNDFKITNVGRIIYNEEKKEYQYVYPNIRNDELYEEIRRIKNESNGNEIDLFYKRR